MNPLTEAARFGLDYRGFLLGWAVFVSEALPIEPSPGEEARRIVRHGMADILAWLGEDVGPAPEDVQHALMLSRDQIVVSPAMYEEMKREAAA